jgi:hypothetical protein
MYRWCFWSINVYLQQLIINLLQSMCVLMGIQSLKFIRKKKLKINSINLFIIAYLVSFHFAWKIFEYDFYISFNLADSSVLISVPLFFLFSWLLVYVLLSFSLCFILSFFPLSFNRFFISLVIFSNQTN